VTARTLPRGLRPFAHRPFRLIWTGQAISLIGTWMGQVAQAWLVLELTGDPVLLGVVAAANFLPVMFLGLFGGAVADAIPKRTGLLVTQSISLVQATILAILTVLGVAEVWQIIALALVLGAVNAFDMPIRQAMTVEMVGREDVAAAVALNSALFNAARIIGPAIAGVLIGVVGIAACFVINAFTYAGVIVALLLVRPSELSAAPRAIPDRSVSAVLEHLVAGLVYVRRTPVVLASIVVIGVVSVAALNFQVTLPLIARDLLSGGPEAFGFLAAASGAGSLVSAMALAFGGRTTLARILTGALVVGLATFAIAFSDSLLLSVVLMFIVGWGLIAMAATTNTIIQVTTPDELRGRVMSVYTTVFAGTSPIGNIATGAIAARAGIAVALMIGGLVAVVCATGIAIWAWRRVDIDLRRQPGRTAPVA
jgi:MFS family permease